MNLESIISTALLVPMKDPSSPNPRWGLNLLLWGNPGIGKSSRIMEATRVLGIACETLIPSTHQPEDFSGVPVPDGKGGAILACTLPAINNLVDLGCGVLFADEINCARPAVQAAFMNLVLERRVASTALPGRVRILSAANPVDTAAGGWELEPPLANRFAHIDMSNPDAEEWVSWLLNGDFARSVNLLQGEERVTAAWPTAWAKASGMMAGFMRSAASLLYALPAEGHPNRGRAWPSPRTWEFATRAIATTYCLESNKDKRDALALDLVTACVGSAAAVQWASWAKKTDLPDPLVMLQDGWTIDTSRLDRTAAAYASMTSFVVNQKDAEKKKALGNRGWELLNDLIKAGVGDLSVQCAKTFIRHGLDSKTCPEARHVLLHFGTSKFADYIEAPKT